MSHRRAAGRGRCRAPRCPACCRPAGGAAAWLSWTILRDYLLPEGLVLVPSLSRDRLRNQSAALRYRDPRPGRTAPSEPAICGQDRSIAFDPGIVRLDRLAVLLQPSRALSLRRVHPQASLAGLRYVDKDRTSRLAPASSAPSRTSHRMLLHGRTKDISRP